MLLDAPGTKHTRESGSKTLAVKPGENPMSSTFEQVVFIEANQFGIEICLDLQTFWIHDCIKVALAVLGRKCGYRRTASSMYWKGPVLNKFVVEIEFVE